MKDKWYVYNFQGELSVSYGNPNEHFMSRGWGGWNKIILGDIREFKDKKKQKLLIKVANIFANELNKLKITPH